MTKMNTDEILALYAIYQNEWEYRDQTMWNIMKMMIGMESGIIVMPFLYGKLLQQYKTWLFIFPLFAIVIDIIYIYVLLRALKRFKRIANTIEKINNKLESDYQKETFKEKGKVSLFNFIISVLGIAFAFISISEIVVLKAM